ncbi:MAG: excinuclease ABC subunit UvrA [Candidatus Pacebacteria bacterium]|nr:excinuclease ABC subunit UvrA [Candidatus Paceibacterota bacterium]
MQGEYIELKGVRVNNLKNIDLKIPKNKLVVICGLSGSGKSSLAFDTIYAEGQRRYLESLSSYARQFLGGLKKPDADRIEGLSPTIAVNQKTISSNPRSTVGTLTEIYDYMRLLFAHIGKAYCPKCGKLVSSQTPHQIADQVYEVAQKGWVTVFAPVVSGKKGEHKGVLEEIYREGWPQVRIDGILYSTDEAKEKNLDKQKMHSIDVLIDRFSLSGFSKQEEKNPQSKKEKEALSNRKEKIKRLFKEEKERILESVKKGLDMGRGRIMVVYQQGKIAKEEQFSRLLTCTKCDISFPDIEPRIFSFNSPYGACSMCQGLGKLLKVDPSLILNPELSLNEGAILPWFSLSRFSLRSLRVPSMQWELEKVSQEYDFSLDVPFKELSEDIQKIVLNGDKSGKTDYQGVVPKMEKLFHETDSDYIREEISKYMTEIICPKCNGARLREEALSIRIKDRNIHDVCSMSIEEAVPFFVKLPSVLSEHDLKIAQPLIKEIIKRFSFLIDVGVEYINLAREATTLSVGENQRIRLACQLGSGLSGVVYVLDEPTIGLHQRDIAKLIKALKQLVEKQNTVIVVEHDQKVMENSDWIIEIGPGAGKFGGKVVFEGNYKNLFKAKTLTGLYLSGKLQVKTKFPQKQISKDTKWLALKGANQFNLKNVDLKIPLEKFVCIAGVSGSGKSTLIIDTLGKALLREINRQKKLSTSGYSELIGEKELNKIIVVDQTPIGRTPRSNPATYTGVFSPIRDLFAMTYQAKLRGYTPSYFSFNTKSGRCPACNGEGLKKVEMYFLPDIYVECETCHGKRFTPEVLKVEYNNKNIAQVLDMSIEEVKTFFSNIPQIKSRMQLMVDIGLGYLRLGQSSTDLSGGEAERIKLANELARRDTGKTIYILDEPTVGLHFDDVSKLLNILRRLVEKGNTIVVIEHNPEVLEEADWIVEMGPEGGDKGGKIVFQGTPKQLKKASTWTGKCL